MSADEGSMPPPPLPDKAAMPAPVQASTSTPASTPAHAPKAAATFTSFINKNTTGKKFAPKAARRRPAVALPATTTTTTEAPTQASPPPPTTVAPPVQPVVQVEREESEVVEESVTPAPQNQVEPEPEPEVPVQTPAQPPTTSETTPASPTRRRRRLPWVAVNHPPEDDYTGETSERTAAAGGAETSQALLGKGKIRWKRKAAPASAESATAEPPSKRTRRPRKAKAKPPAEIVDAGDEADAVDVEENVEETVTRKPRRTTKKKKKQATENDTQEAQPKRKGRPSRESTPSDAEERTIDPEITFMDSLATRNIRVGKLSTREKQMREVDWVAVRERRREEDARPVQSKKEQEAADKLLAEAGLLSHVSAGGDHEAAAAAAAIGWMMPAARSGCRGTVAECLENEDEEFELDSESNRRILATRRYISYGALQRNSVPCSRRGASYYNCRPGAQANPYRRGCSAITRCRG